MKTIMRKTLLRPGNIRRHRCAGLLFVLGLCLPLEVLAQPALSLVYVSGTNQSGTANSALASPLVVQLEPDPGFDGPSTGNIAWSVIGGTATIVESGGTSYAQNYDLPASAPGFQPLLQQIHMALGATAGAVTVRAYCAVCAQSGQGKPGIAYVQDFTLTITPPTLQVVSGNGQTGALGSAADAPLVVQLGTAGGTSLSGQIVNWRVVSGVATLSAATALTDSNSQASITFSYGNSAGPIVIQASAPNTLATFTETAFAANATTLSGNNQTGIAGGSLQPFTIQLTTPGAASSSKGLSQVAVNWSVIQGGGTLAAPTTLTDASGKSSNTLTLGANAGVNIVQATVAGIGSITFTATAIASIGSDSRFTIVSGSNQALIPGRPSQSLVVKLAASQGQPISGATVQWSVSGSSGQLTTASTTTDGSGLAQNQVTVILPGSYTVTAKLADAPNVPALTFSFNNAVANLPALTPGQIAVAHAIDQACPALAAMAPAQLTSPQQDLLQRCSEIVVRSGTNPQQVPNALDQMLNNKALPQNQLANSVQRSQFGNLNTRLAELRQGAQGISLHGLTLSNDGQSLPLAMLGDLFRKDPQQPDDEVGKDFQRWGFFATGMIERGGFSADAARPAFDFHNASLTAGVDYRFSDALVAGAALGYNQSNSSLGQNFGKVDVDSFSLNGYFTWYHNNDFYVEGSAALDWLSYDLSRNIAYQIASLSGNGSTTVNQSTSASPDGHQAALSLSLGKEFSHGAWTTSPYVRGVYTHVNLGGFSETVVDPNGPGAGLGTSVESRSSTSVLGVLGSRFSYATSVDWGVLVPNATIEWNHEFKHDPQTIVTRFLADPTQTPIVVSANPPDQSYFNIGIGLNAVLPKGRSGFVSWEHLVGYAGAHQNRFSLGVRIEF